MKLFSFLFTASLFFSISVFANNYEEAWKALNRNDRSAAKQFLEKAFNDPVNAVDAYITYMYLLSFEGKDGKITEFIPNVYSKLNDPNPYVYALWFQQGVLGDYGKKTAVQQNLLDKILSDGKCNGSIISAAHYVQSWAYLASADIPESVTEAEKMGSVGPLWQLVGPFDNVAGSGFEREPGPLQHPESSAIFKSADNADIKWFTPTVMNKDGWTFPYAHIRYSTAVLYAQEFIYAPEDMKVLLNAGFNGAIKIWVNDAEVLTEKKELVTELDAHKNYTQLKKGYNRLLVKLSYTNNSFPNFIVRITDENLKAVDGLTYTSENQVYQKSASAENNALQSLPHFAESYFENKVKKEPGNIINYVLLCDTYLRDKRTTEARTLIEDIVQKFPENSLLRLELMSCYLKEGNNMLLLRETERMKEKDPGCMLAAMLNIQKLMDTEKYSEADEEIKNYDQQFGEENTEMFDTKVKLYSQQNKISELVNYIQAMYKKFPENTAVLELMFNVKMKVDKDVNAALQVYEHFLENNYNYDIIKKLADEYKNQGMADKELKILRSLTDNFSYDPELSTFVANYYFDQQDYAKATEWAKKALALAPYVSAYWENLGVEFQQMKSDKEAIDAYKKAVYFNANSYNAREQLRTIEKKPSVWKAFPEPGIYEMIRKSKDSIKDKDYYYLADQKFSVLYPQGASEDYYTYVIKIVNDKGINAWKETSIPYNSNSSYLIIDKAETVKINGSKSIAEQDGNQLVFTSLEAGDAIVIKYKLQHYGSGRIGKEFWNKYDFKKFVPQELANYCILVSNDVKFNYKNLNTDLKPVVSKFDDFTLYNWKMEHCEALKEESFMPPEADITPSVAVSTIPSWSFIAGWYNDLSFDKMEPDYEVKKVFTQLFPNGTKNITQMAIAETIYDYVCKNIRYSSVSFRQSAYTPQKPSTTITSALGDCKDLSTLFVTLGKMAGITANLVLVSTRDNGRQLMPLPSMEFNHCIVKAQLDGKPYFLELTDNTLPFASLPSSLRDASCLVIPLNASDTAAAKLQNLVTENRVREKTERKTALKVVNNDIDIKATITKTGVLTSSWRSKYATLPQDERLKQMEKSISGNYKNAVKLNSVSFKGLDSLDATLNYKCEYNVKDEVAELGDIRMIKIPFEDVVATMDNFSATERKYPIEYYRYEDADEYITEIEIEIPGNTHFIELPKDVSFNFLKDSYSLKYVKKDNSHLLVARNASLQRDDVAPENYAALKVFLANIVKAESKFIAFKPD